jgi:hypothetical protein
MTRFSPTTASSSGQNQLKPRQEAVDAELHPARSQGDVRALLETVAEELGMKAGIWRLEARYENGNLLRIDRHHEKVPASALGPSKSRRGSR